MRLSEGLIKNKDSVYDKVICQIKELIADSKSGQVILFGAGVGGRIPSLF